MPPYSDNLYSADDDGNSDTESFSDELTPSDGYFQRSSMPSTGRLVPDPSIDHGPPEAKTLIESPRLHPRNRAGPSQFPSVHSNPPSVSSLATSPPYMSPGTSQGRTQYTAVSPVSSRRREPSFSEHESLMYQPPPAYSESPAPSSVSSVANPTTYSTFQFQHLERGFPLPRPEPQSMGGPLNELTSEDTPLVSPWKLSPRRKKVKVLLFAGLVLVVIGTTLTILFGCSEGSDSKKEKLLDTDTEYCPSASIVAPQTAYEFSSGKGLNILHKINDDRSNRGFAPVSTEGEIRLRKAPKDSKHGTKPYVTVDMGASTQMTTTLDWSEHSQTLRLTTPATVEKYSYKPQCLYVIITAFFPEDTELTTLMFDTPTLNIALSDTRLNVTDHSHFNTVSGDVWLTFGDIFEIQPIPKSGHRARKSSPAFFNGTITADTEMSLSSRKTVIETLTGDIKGTYPLLDELVLSSQSGDISVVVSPQSASKNAPAPADLEVQTASGAIRVDLPLEPKTSIPHRDYVTRVHSTTGDISGTYYLGSDSHFKATSGSISFDALPVVQEESQSSKLPPNIFETHTVSGSSKIRILDPLILPRTPSTSSQDPFDPYDILFPPIAVNEAPEVSLAQTQESSQDSKLRSLRSSHSSNTGDIAATYSDSWQGGVHVRTVSGDIKVRGDGFRTVKERNGWGYKEVLKRRGVDGTEGSKVEVGTVSGSVKFDIDA